MRQHWHLTGANAELGPLPVAPTSVSISVAPPVGLPASGDSLWIPRAGRARAPYSNLTHPCKPWKLKPLKSASPVFLHVRSFSFNVSPMLRS